MRPDELLDLLRGTEVFVPFVGAGLAIPAGAPNTRELADALADRSGVSRGSLTAVTQAATSKLGESAAQEAVAAIFRDRAIRATPDLVALAQWPAQRILTTNYDLGIEAAARMAGLQPVTLLPRDADALVAPPAGTVHVVHVHGVQTDPSSIVLPGLPTLALSANEIFLSNVRAMMQQAAMLYLGFRLGPNEFHLRSALAWLTQVRNARRHVLVIPAEEIGARGEELEELRAVPQLSVVGFDPIDGDDYRFVTQVAGVCAPRADATGSFAEQLSGDLAPAYVLPALVAETEDDDLERLQGKVWAAEFGWGEPFVEPDVLLKTGPALVLAAPGMGRPSFSAASRRTRTMGPPC